MFHIFTFSFLNVVSKGAKVGERGGGGGGFDFTYFSRVKVRLKSIIDPLKLSFRLKNEPFFENGLNKQ